MRWGEARQSHCRSGLLKLLVNSSHRAWCRLISNTSSIICGDGDCNMRLVQREAATARCCRRHSARSQNRASNATSLTISSATTAAACAALLAPCARIGSTVQWTSPIASDFRQYRCNESMAIVIIAKVCQAFEVASWNILKQQRRGHSSEGQERNVDEFTVSG